MIANVVHFMFRMVFYLVRLMFSQVCWAQSLIHIILSWLDQVASHAADQTCSEGIEKEY